MLDKQKETCYDANQLYAKKDLYYMPLFTMSQLKGPNGKCRTKSLFYELSYYDTTDVIFTTKEHDITVKDKLYVSLQQLFVKMVPHDPTEYEFAQAVFGSWNVWKGISEAPQIKPFVNHWRNEVVVKVKSQAIQAIAEEMKSNGRSSFSAAKLLLDKGWLDNDTASQAKKKLQAKEQEEENKQALSLLENDAQRLGLKVN